MSVLKSYFDRSINQSSRNCVDLSRVVNLDDKGNEVITWCPVDYASIQASNGFVSDWSLENLIKAGVDPAFPIRTGSPTRIEGVGAVSQFVSKADELLSNNDDDNNE